MVKIAFEELSFSHVVIFSKENTSFATARQGKRKTRLFLVFGEDGRVYTRNGLVSSWELLGDDEGKVIRAKIKGAVEHQGITVYKLNCPSGGVVGRISQP